MKLQNERRETIAAGILLAVGLLQMTGKIIDAPMVAGLGAATCASPHPKVFSSVRGLETFSTDFYLDWKDVNGSHHSLELTPEAYSRVRGPYNRRNVYGAALAYGPVLASDPKVRPMFEQVMRFALTGDAPLLRELGVDPDHVLYPITVRMQAEREDKIDDELPLSFQVGIEKITITSNDDETE